MQADGCAAAGRELEELLGGPAGLAGLGPEEQEGGLVAVAFLSGSFDKILAAATTPEAAAGFRGCAAWHLTRLLRATTPPVPVPPTDRAAVTRARRGALLVSRCNHRHSPPEHCAAASAADDVASRSVVLSFCRETWPSSLLCRIPLPVHR